MTFRIKFAKYGNLKFLSHLDVMRFFQKAIRRAEIDIKYSEGYHPHQIMSFAAPLGVGQTSEGEYFDMELNSYTSEEDIFNRLNQEMPEGFRVISAHLLPDVAIGQKHTSVMALVKASDYIVQKKGEQEISLTNEEFLGKFREFVKNDEIFITRKSKAKAGEVTENVSPYIYEVRTDAVPTEFCTNYNSGICMYLMLSAGGENHVRPELLMKSFCEYAGIPFDPYDYYVHRLDSYTYADGKYVSVNDFS